MHQLKHPNYYRHLMNWLWTFFCSVRHLINQWILRKLLVIYVSKRIWTWASCTYYAKCLSHLFFQKQISWENRVKHFKNLQLGLSHLVSSVERKLRPSLHLVVPAAAATGEGEPLFNYLSSRPSRREQLHGWHIYCSEPNLSQKGSYQTFSFEINLAEHLKSWKLQLAEKGKYWKAET